MAENITPAWTRVHCYECAPRVAILPPTLGKRLERELFLLALVEGRVTLLGIQTNISGIGTQALLLAPVAANQCISGVICEDPLTKTVNGRSAGPLVLAGWRSR